MQKHAALLSATTAGAIALFGIGGVAIASHPGARAPASPATAATSGAAATLPAPAAATASSGTLIGPDMTPLTRMIQALSTTSHNVTMKTSTSIVRASVDPANESVRAVAQSTGLEISEVVDRGSVYVMADLGSDLNKQVGIKPHTWMKLDPAQIKADNQLLVQPDGSDPVDMPGMMTGMTALRQIDATHLAGTIDLTRIKGHTRPDPDEVSKAGTAATKVPFTVTADPQGRITEFKVDASAFDPILSLDVVYSNYGAAMAVAAPTGSVPAPQNVYILFND